MLKRSSFGVCGFAPLLAFTCGLLAVPYPNEAEAQATRMTQPFNLLCDGTVTRFSKEDTQEAAFSQTFRIDLDAGRYCDGDCGTTMAITKIEPTQITLFDHISPAGFGRELTISRETGKLDGYSMSVGGSLTFTTAQCRIQPFSGFPIPKF